MSDELAKAARELSAIILSDDHDHTLCNAAFHPCACGYNDRLNDAMFKLAAVVTLMDSERRAP